MLVIYLKIKASLYVCVLEIISETKFVLLFQLWNKTKLSKKNYSVEYFKMHAIQRSDLFVFFLKMFLIHKTHCT